LISCPFALRDFIAVIKPELRASAALEKITNYISARLGSHLLDGRTRAGDWTALAMVQFDWYWYCYYVSEFLEITTLSGKNS
jgi:hypothetical protein